MQSMTGFGCAEHATKTLAARVEAASVNRKQGEIIINLPRAYHSLEADIRKTALEKLSRGRVTLSIQTETPDATATNIQVNEKKARALEAAFTTLSDAIDRPVKPSASDFLSANGVFEFAEPAVELSDAQSAIMPAVLAALDTMIAMRKEEGNHLLKDIIERIHFLEKTTNEIESRAPIVKQNYKETLISRLSEAEVEFELDDERILREIRIFCDRCDISEETTRLRSHFEKFHSLLVSNSAIGRPLDFLCQEINREFNTIGSKANDAELAQMIVTAKTELEKVREQVQNVE